MTFQERLEATIKKTNSLLCVALDADFEKLPLSFRDTKNPQLSFNKWIIDQTVSFVSAYKPNTAFYEARGEQGITELRETCHYIKTNYPDHLVILDAKRGDIGNTNTGYVTYAFEIMKADAITLHPYLGEEALQPFLQREDKGSIILCRTSNPGAGEFQDLMYQDEPLYKLVARQVITKWDSHHNCMLVIGATYPEEMKSIREIDDAIPFLVPGIGTQGGDLQKTLAAGLNSLRSGLLITVGRSIIFAENPGEEAQKLQEEINNLRFI